MFAKHTPIARPASSAARDEMRPAGKWSFRLLARAGIATTADGLAQIDACADAASLDRWIDNVIGAKTLAEVLT